MKYAIVEAGGKQFKAVEGDTIEVDRLTMDAGEEVTIDSVLLVVDDDKVLVGNPVVKGAKVKTSIESHEKGPKLIIFKYRPKKHYRAKTGHRQQYTLLRVNSIEME